MIGSDGPSIRRKLGPESLRAAHYIFGAVLLVRLIVLIRLASSPVFLPTESDMHFYDAWAKQILHGHWTDHQAFYGQPLYPFLVALLYRLFGYGPFVPAFFQTCLDAGTAVLIYKITVRAINHGSDKPGTAGNVAGIAAAAAWCFFLPAQAYSAILMPTAGGVFIFWLLIWQVVRNGDAPPRWRCFVCGVLIGFTAMGIATILFLIPLFAGAIFIRRTELGLAAKGVALVLLFAGVFVGASPCWIHNYFVARDPVFLSAHSGINLWLGNNPAATGYPRFPVLHAGQGKMLRDSIEQAETAAGRPLKRSEVSRYWSNKAYDYILEDPGGWLKLVSRKIANFWNAFEYDDLGVIANLRSHGVLFPGLHFGLVALLGLAGAVTSWRTSAGSRWIVAAVLLQFVAVLPVFVTERYRLPVVPGLLVLVVLGLHRLRENVINRKYVGVAVQFALVMASAIFVTAPRPDPSLWALEDYNSGRLALETNDLPTAETHLQRARALVPDNPEIILALGNLRLAQSDRAEAIGLYEAVLRLDSRHKSALNNLGVIALEDQRFTDAKEYFRRALEEEPQNAKTHFLLAKTELALGNIAAARIALALALEREPDRREYQELQEQIERRAQP